MQWPAIAFADLCLRTSLRRSAPADSGSGGGSSSGSGVGGGAMPDEGTMYDVLNVGAISLLSPSPSPDTDTDTDPARDSNSGSGSNSGSDSACFGVSTLPAVGDGGIEQTANYMWFALDRLSQAEAGAMRLLTARHGDAHRVYAFLMRRLAHWDAHTAAAADPAYAAAAATGGGATGGGGGSTSGSAPPNPLTAPLSLVSLQEPVLAWVVHCGGSQGMEAATILQTLDRMVRGLVYMYTCMACLHTHYTPLTRTYKHTLTYTHMHIHTPLHTPYPPR
jgi:hypothetical protein